jgi:hypothetical protein
MSETTALGMRPAWRVGVIVRGRITGSNHDSWELVMCRFCECQFECITGKEAHLTRTCLWCAIAPPIRAARDEQR